MARNDRRDQLIKQFVKKNPKAMGGRRQKMTPLKPYSGGMLQPTPPHMRERE